MADCNQTLREVYEYLDGELTDDDRHHIQRHLDDCSPCLEAFDFEAELKFVVRDRCREEVPENLRVRIAQVLALECGDIATGSARPARP